MLKNLLSAISANEGRRIGSMISTFWSKSKRIVAEVSPSRMLKWRGSTVLGNLAFSSNLNPYLVLLIFVLLQTNFQLTLSHFENVTLHRMLRSTFDNSALARSLFESFRTAPTLYQNYCFHRTAALRCITRRAHIPMTRRPILSCKGFLEWIIWFSDNCFDNTQKNFRSSIVLHLHRS